MNYSDQAQSQAYTGMKQNIVLIKSEYVKKDLVEGYVTKVSCLWKCE